MAEFGAELENVDLTQDDVPEIEDIPEFDDVPETEAIPELEDIPETEDFFEVEDIPEIEEIPEAEEVPGVEDIPDVEEAPETVGDVPVDPQANLELEDDLQISVAVDALNQMPELDPQTWDALDTEEKIETLQNIENTMSEIQGRPPVPVSAEVMDQSIFGGYDGKGITVNSNHFESKPVEEFVNTMVHEGRHAYQDFAIANPGTVADEGTVAAWANNQGENYLRPEEYGQEIYETQPVEQDAFTYGNRVTNALIASNLGKVEF